MVFFERTDSSAFTFIFFRMGVVYSIADGVAAQLPLFSHRGDRVGQTFCLFNVFAGRRVFTVDLCPEFDSAEGVKNRPSPPPPRPPPPFDFHVFLCLFEVAIKQRTGGVQTGTGARSIRFITKPHILRVVHFIDRSLLSFVCETTARKTAHLLMQHLGGQRHPLFLLAKE